MTLKKTGYTSQTAKRFLMDAGVVFANCTFDELTGLPVGNPLGATSGGVTFTIEQNYRDIEVDGTSHTKVKGNKVLESAFATVTINLKEITAENIRKALNGELTENTPTGYSTITTKRYLEDTDYISNLVIAGKLSGTDKQAHFILYNVVSTGGIEIGMEDNGEAIIELTFEAHADVDQLHADKFPWDIQFPDEMV